MESGTKDNLNDAAKKKATEIAKPGSDIDVNDGNDDTNDEKDTDGEGDTDSGTGGTKSGGRPMYQL